MALKILVVDDEEPARQGLTALLARWGYDVDEAGDGQEALAKAAAGLPSVVVSDLVMPKMDGLELLRALKTDVPFASVILLTGQGSIDTAVTAMREGAYDYLTKPVDVARLRLLVPKAAERGEALREVALLRRKLSQVWGLGRLVGTSAGMQEVYRAHRGGGPHDGAGADQRGERHRQGAGGAHAARSLPAAQGPFVAVNCAAIPETLLESEIFGHEKGAFTGALERRPGCFELAARGHHLPRRDRGDESRAPRPSSSASCRTGRCGGSAAGPRSRWTSGCSPRPTRIRSRPSRRARSAKTSTTGLNVVSLVLPPAARAAGRHPGARAGVHRGVQRRATTSTVRALDEAVLSGLVAQPWPGNVRELRNTLERAIIVCETDTILPKHIPAVAVPAPWPTAGEGPDSVSFRVGTSLEDAEKALILKTLAANGNNKTRAADVLGISLKTLHNKLKTYGS